MDIHGQSFLCKRKKHQDTDKENGFRKAVKCQGHGHGILGAYSVCAVSYKASVAGQCLSADLRSCCYICIASAAKTILLV